MLQILHNIWSSLSIGTRLWSRKPGIGIPGVCSGFSSPEHPDLVSCTLILLSSGCQGGEGNKLAWAWRCVQLTSAPSYIYITWFFMKYRTALQYIIYRACNMDFNKIYCSVSDIFHCYEHLDIKCGNAIYDCSVINFVRINWYVNKINIKLNH